MKRKIKFLSFDDLPFIPPSPKKQRVVPTTVNNFGAIVDSDTSGALLVEKWQSAWKYRDNHVRVVSSTNKEFPEDTVFANSKMAAMMLRQSGYHVVHKSIVNDSKINGCELEYTSTRLKDINHYLRGDRRPTIN